MTDRAEIERLLNQTGRTLEGLPESYESEDALKASKRGRERAWTLGEVILHQSDVIELLTGALRDSLEKQPKWISAEERLPESEDEKADCYLVTDGDFIWMAYYACKEWQFAQCTDSPYVIDWTDITHWMPLPEPPKEDV